MDNDKVFDVDDAYALEEPEDCIRLYDKWAKTYDDDFVDRVHYLQFRQVAEQLLLRKDKIFGPVLDVGCGTGVVGICLRDGGIAEVDGIDISREMLEVAREKKASAGDAAYRNLIQADLTQDIDIEDDYYSGLVSAGTFTHGHLGPDSLDELWRVAAPEAQCAFTVRATHYNNAGFSDKLASDVDAGLISGLELVEVNIYADDTPDREHAKDTSYIVVCQVVK